MFPKLMGRSMFFFAPDKGGGGGDDEETELTEAEKGFEAFLLTLPEELRAGVKAQHEGLRGALKSERKNSKTVSKKLTEFEQAELDRKNKELSEVDRLKKEKEASDKKVEKAERDLQQERIKNRFIAEASKVQFGEGDKKSKFIDPEAAYTLAIANGAEMKVDEDGKIVGVADALKNLAKESPWTLEAGEVPKKQPGPTKGKEPGPEQEEKAKQEVLDRKRAEYSPL